MSKHDEQPENDEQENDPPTNDETNGKAFTIEYDTGPPKRKLRRRGFDYPPSLYQSSYRKKRRAPNFSLSVRWDSNGTKEQVFTSRQNQTVSIPSNLESENSLFWKGDVLESVERAALKTRLLNERYYAREEAFKKENLQRAPGLEDLVSTDVSPWTDKFWITIPARMLTFGAACLVFPYVIMLLDRFVTMEPDQLDNITNKFGPGISILYGTFTSLTISILYNRQKGIQENVATESSLIVLLLRNVLSLFRGHEELTLEAGQTVADQIRTLVKSSRGVELMQIIYSDPYARIFELVDNFERQVSDEELNRKGSLFASCRDLLKDLTRSRSIRLAEEARALPPTHFLILNVLTFLILLAYCINVLPTLDRIGSPPAESIWIFGLLTTIYAAFYSFAMDLNNPFAGVYQVRRSTGASHLLEAKWLIANHPILRDQVDFEVATEDSEGVLIRTPGVGDCVFEKDELFVGAGKDL